MIDGNTSALNDYMREVEANEIKYEKDVRNLFLSFDRLVGFRGTITDIEDEIQSMLVHEELIIDSSVSLGLFSEDNSVDIGYCFTVDNEYDFDLYVIETRKKIDDEVVFYITEINEAY